MRRPRTAKSGSDGAMVAPSTREALRGLYESPAAL
jgi:hypothetical protein